MTGEFQCLVEFFLYIIHIYFVFVFSAHFSPPVCVENSINYFEVLPTSLT